jgi:hypothetical protein
MLNMMAALLPRADLDLLAGDAFQDFVGRDTDLAKAIGFAVGQAGEGNYAPLDLGKAGPATVAKLNEFAGDVGTADEQSESATALAFKLGG